MLSKLRLTIIIILTIIMLNNALFHNPLKKLKQKTKEAYKKKFGRDKTWHFLGFDLTEYPGTNEKYRHLNQEKWNDYYTCLTSQNTKLGHEFSITPEAIEAIASSSISPLEMHKSDLVEWQWAPPQSSKLVTVEYGENILLSPSDKALQIYNVQDEHSGQFLCRIGEAEASPYFLNVVVSNDENLINVHDPEAPTEPHPTPPEQVNGTNLILDTEWTTWTACSKCNKIGRRHRFGYCVVKYNNHSNLQQNPTGISLNSYKLLEIFKFGIPCRSFLLPYEIKSLSEVQNRKNEIMTGFCKMNCPDNEIFEIRDKDGNVIERANNSAGIYSVLQGVPSPQPNVERILQYAEKGKEVVLICPGNLNTDAPVQWQIGSKKLIPELIVSESKGRIYVSITDKIHIKNAKISDTNVYSCWQHEDLAGTVRLIVEKQFSLDFNHHIMLCGSILIALILLYVTVKVFSRRKISHKAI